MAKISALPALPTLANPTGAELVPVVHQGETYSAPLGPLVQPQVDRAAAYAAAAGALANRQDSYDAGMAATTPGQTFSVLNSATGFADIYVHGQGDAGHPLFRMPGDAAYSGPGGADLVGTALAPGLPTRVLAAKAREIATIQDFAIVATGADYQTQAWQAAIDWASQNNRLVEDKLGAVWTTGPLMLKYRAMIRSPSAEGTTLVPRLMTAAEAANELLCHGHLNLAPGPVNYTYLEGLNFVGNNLNPDTWGWYMRALKDPAPGAYPQGGWWESETRRCSATGYGEGGMWLRAGSNGTGANPDDYSTYDNLRPHQFLDFIKMRLQAGFKANGPARLRTGQNAQQFFTRSNYFGNGANPLIVDSPESIDADSVIRGGANRSYNFVPISSGGGFNAEEHCFPQGSSIAAIISKANSLKLNLYVENGTVGGLKLQNCDAVLERSQFNNAGSGSGQAIVELLGGVRLVGHGNNGNTASDGFQIRGVGNNYVAPGLFSSAGRTSGLTQQYSAGGDGGLSTQSRTDIFLNSSTVPIHALASDLTWGQELVVRAFGGVVIFAETSDGNIHVPGGRIILREGDIVILRREDNLKDWWIVSQAIAPLTSKGKPTTGYFEQGELVRNTGPVSSTTYASHFFRRDTGTNNDPTNDWFSVLVTLQ